jgi:predicted permease
MRWLSEVHERFRSTFFQATEDAEMEDELRMHLEMQAAHNRKLGMTPEEADRQAKMSLGAMDSVREEVREQRGLGIVDEWRADIRYALRALRRDPGFTAVALLTLALGIGVNTAMFSIVNGILLRPLPYYKPDQLMLVHQANPKTGDMLGRISFQDLEDWRTRTHAMQKIAGYAPVPSILMGQGDPVEVEMTYVTDDFFPLLGARPQLGRSLDADDHRQARRVAVISDRMWRQYLGARRTILGSTISLRGVSYTVVGVMSPGMRHPTPETDAWVPQSLVEPNMFSNGMPKRGDRYLQSIARLRDGTTTEQAEQEMNAISRQLAQAYPESNSDWNAATVIPLQTALTGDVRQALIIVLGVVGFILLIGCANIANLLLARGSARKREIAIRMALGAGRRRIVRQLLTESVVLGVLGGFIGLALAHYGLRVILALSAKTLPRMEDVRLDGTVLLFALVLSTITGIVFGLVPALRMSAIDPQHDLRGGRGSVGAEGQRLRGMLVIAEVALAVLLVVGAGLMARSFLALRSVNPGFNPDHVLTVSMQINLAGVPDSTLSDFVKNRRETILERVRALPGVQSAGMINSFPLSEGRAFFMEYQRAGQEKVPNAPTVNADTRYVDPGYLGTMGIPIRRGVGIPVKWADDGAVPTVLSESAARKLFGDEDPIGKQLAVTWGQAVIVGVAGDVRQIGLSAAPLPAIYFPQLIAPRLLATMVIRSSLDATQLGNTVRQVIKDIDANQPIRSITPLRSYMGESIARDRFFTLLFAVFGSLALLLSAVGIYGVLAYSVRQRTQEIGVRMAMGARGTDVLRLVGRGGMSLVGIGVAIGTAASMMMSRVLSSQLFGISATDPVTFAAAIGFLCVTALFAIYIPARRATRVPPMIALRPE